MLLTANLLVILKQASLALAMALLLATTASAARVFEPKAGSADYLSIMAVHKNSELADQQIEPYKVVLINMAHTRKISIAYVDARATGDDLVVFEQVLIRKRGGAWQSVWRNGSGGSNECAEGIKHYSKIIRFVRQRGIDSRKLLPGFQDTLANARKGIECSFGEFEINAAIVK